MRGCQLQMLARGPFSNTVLSLVPAWKCNYIHDKVLDEITYPFQNFNGATVEVYEWIDNFTPHFLAM